MNEPLTVSNVLLFVFIAFSMFQQQMMFRSIMETQAQTMRRLLRIEARLLGLPPH